MTLPSESNVPPFSLLWPSDLSAAVQAEKTWLWHGYLKPGGTTLLTSQWKSGKSTLISVLFSRLKTGGQLAGLPLAPGRAVIVSEESPEDWHRRAQCLDFGDHVGFLCRPFRAKPRPEQWRALLDHLAPVCSQHHITLVVIDTLGSFLPGRDENNAGVMMETLLSLQRLTTMGVSVLVTHHPAKKP
ncbi:MAG: AAA family ATPase, partial [Planctomycetes bacterium]|nr:AAA family ATPase [Planctomycetota bacterium]